MTLRPFDNDKHSLIDPDQMNYVDFVFSSCSKTGRMGYNPSMADRSKAS